MLKPLPLLINTHGQPVNASVFNVVTRVLLTLRSFRSSAQHHSPLLCLVVTHAALFEEGLVPQLESKAGRVSVYSQPVEASSSSSSFTMLVKAEELSLQGFMVQGLDC